jgi:hypothetical protein
MLERGVAGQQIGIPAESRSEFPIAVTAALKSEP